MRMVDVKRKRRCRKRLSIRKKSSFRDDEERGKRRRSRRRRKWNRVWTPDEKDYTG